MVGVPRSTGCQSCIRRRIKCDERRPVCRRCEIRGLQCPGYEKAAKFYHFAPQSDAGDNVNDSTSPTAGSTTSISKLNSSTSTTSSMHVMASDAWVAPSLTQKAFSIQQKEIFGQFVDETFPGLYYSWSTRVDVSFMDFVRRQDDSSKNSFVWAAKTLSTLSVAQKRGDERRIDLCRAMYARGLRHLMRLVRDPKAVKLDHTLGTAVLLAIYEMMDGSFQQSWLTHSRGIAALFRHRGPEAHRDGFGRTLLISFRSFLLADSLIRGEPCFLAEPEWRAVILHSMKEERKAGKGSEIGDLVECAFHEITVCPGLVARVREMLAGDTYDVAQRELLIRALKAQRARLGALHARLLVVSSQGEKIEKMPDVVGPIPRAVVHNLTKFSLQGIHVAMMLMERLSSSLEDHETGGFNVDTCLKGLLNRPCLERDGKVASDEEKVTETPDNVALSMGMLVLT